MGDLLRRHKRHGLITDAHIRDCINDGTLVPAEYLAHVLQSFLAGQERDLSRVILLDGVPRRRDQIETIQTAVRMKQPQTKTC